VNTFSKFDWLGHDAKLLPRQRGIIWFCFAVAFLAFVSSIAFGAWLSIGRDAALWENSVLGRLTVQIMPDGLAPPPAEIPAAIAVLKGIPGVVSADLVDKSANLALVEPWLGHNASLDTLPFPALIDVKLAPGAVLVTEDVQKRLLASAPHAVVDEHRRSSGEIGAAPERSRWLAALLLWVSACMFLFLCLSATRAHIWTQWNNLELLRLLGATDWRVAQLCGTWSELTVLLTSAAGALLAGVLFSLRPLLEAFGAHAFAALIPGLFLAQLPWLVFIPLTATIIAWMTGRLLVMSALRRV
jgi:cell division transport system permease protein